MTDLNEAALADSELVERLRDHESHCTSSGYHPPMNLLDRAADRIAALSAEMERLTRERGEAAHAYSMLQNDLRNCAWEQEKYRNNAMILDGDLCSMKTHVATLTKRLDEAAKVIRWAHDTLYEINPSNYDHDEVCKLNDASVEVILGLAPILGETHGKSDEWWQDRAALSEHRP